jgi:hypothetical protein
LDQEIDPALEQQKTQQSLNMLYQHNTKLHSGLIFLFIIGLTTTQKIIIRIKGSELQRVIDEGKTEK